MGHAPQRLIQLIVQYSLHAEKMRVLKLFLLSCLFVFTITILWLSSASVNRLVDVYTDQLTIKCVLKESNEYMNSNHRFCFRKNVTEEIVIAVVTCGLRATESLNMVKSALIFNTNRNPLRFIIITENNLMDEFREKVIIGI